ncbi:MAG: S8 family serine peptidase [Candidatus Sericytochromatia bacterium]
MKKPPALLLALFALTACQTGLTPPSTGAEAPTVPGELVVRFQPGTSEAAKAELRQRLGATGVASVMADGERWKLADAAVDGAIATLQADDRIKLAQRNGLRRLNVIQSPAVAPPGFSVLQAATSDPESAKQWHLQRVKFPAAWAKSRGRGITVAVIDSGVDPNHPDLKANLLPMIDEVVAMGEKDILNGTNYNERDGHGHGTHVCGLVGALANNAIGVSGAAPEVKILPVKVTNANGDAGDAAITKGITDAVDKGAQVINLSIGGPEPSPILLEALNYAFQKNVAVVIASGNDSRAVNYPAAYDGVLSVGAITEENKVARYSSHGERLVMVAPGGGGPGGTEGRMMFSTTPTYDCNITLFERKTKDYGYMAGTSMAAPLVTAAAALLLALEPGLPPAQIRTRLAATADDGGDAGFDEFFGYGVLNAQSAVNANTDDGRKLP